MLGSGVIAESIISFKITWQNPGSNQQPVWDQNKQEIVLHSSAVYPDLNYTKAQGLATYYHYTTLDAIFELIRKIDAIIDNKLSSVTEAEQPKVEPAAEPTKPQGPPPSAPESPKPKDDVTSDSTNQGQPSEPANIWPYTVSLYGENLQMLDGQVSSANVRIRHKVSDNLIRKIPENPIDNSKNIWVEVKSGSSTVRMAIDEFTVEDNINLLVQLLPTVDITLVPGEKHVTPKTAEEVEYRDKLKFMSGIRMSREEERFTRAKQEIEADRKRFGKKS